MLNVLWDFIGAMYVQNILPYIMNFTLGTSTLSLFKLRVRRFSPAVLFSF